MSPASPSPEAAAPLGRRERKKLATRRALQRAALDLAIERGADVTVEEICEVADVSARTFFNYFRAKEEAMVGEPPAVPADELLADYEAGGPTGRTMTDLGLALAPHLEHTLPTLEQMHLRHELFADHPELLAHFVGGFARIEMRLGLATARREDLPAEDPHAQLVGAVATAAMRTAVRRWIRGDGQRPVSEHVHDVFSRLDAGL